MPGSRSFPTSLAAVQQGGARGIELWATDAAGSLWTIYQTTAGGSWSGWEGPGFKGQPAAAARTAAALRGDGNVQLFMLDRSGLVWTVAQYAPGGDWGAWQGPAFNGQPAGFVEIAAAGASGGIQLWALDATGAVWTTWQSSPNAGWAGWQQFGGATVPFRRLAASGQNNGALILFGLDTANQVWAMAQSAPASAWGGWNGPGIGGQAFDVLEITAAQQSGNRGAELWGVSPDGSVMTLWQTTPGGPWSPWEGPFKEQAGPARGLAAADQNTGNVLLVARNTDNSMSTIAQYTAGGDWGGWSPLAGFSGIMPSPQDELLGLLAGYFPLDGSTEDPLAPSLTATLAGATQWVPAWGARDGLQPSDATGLCTFPKLSMPPPATGASVAFWFKGGTVTGVEPVLYTDASGLGVTLPSATALRFTLAGSPIQDVAPATLLQGEWNHVAVSVQSLGESGYVLNAWVNGTRCASAMGGGTVTPAQMFASHAIGSGPQSSSGGIGFSGFTMFSAAIGDADALYLASDLFHPEATHAAEIEYLGARLDGGTAIACPDGPGLALSGAFTVTTWLFAEMLTYRLFPYSAVEQELFAASGRCRFFFDAQGRLSAWYTTASGPAQLSVDTAPLYLDRFDWLHLAFSYDPTAGAQLYVNGELVTAAQAVAAEAWQPATPVSIGSGVQQGMYGVTVYGKALSAQEIAEDLSLDVPTEGLPADAIVFYDLSAVPPVALSADTGLAGALTAPETMVYDVYSAGAALVAGGYVDCGYDPDALIPSGTSFSLDAWVYPGAPGNTGTIASRLQGGRGYRVFLQDGMIAAELHGTQPWQSLLAWSDVPLPAEEWSRIGVAFTNEVGNTMALTLYLNGRRLASVKRGVPPGSADPTIADPETRLMVGARWDDTAAAAADGLNGFVQRLRFYNSAVAFDQLFSGPGWTAGDPVSDWFLGDDFPRDLTDDEPATLMGSASTDTVVWSASPAGVAGLAGHRLERVLAFRESLFADEHFPNRWDEVPAEHQRALMTTNETAGQIVAVTLDEASYLVAHGDPGSTPGVFHIGRGDDPTAQWVCFILEVVSLGLAVWGLRAGSTDKLVKTGMSMWKNPAVRQAIIAVTEISAAEQVPGVFIGLLQATYSSGFISRLLACYSLSFFTILRFAAMFAPWAAWALIAYDLQSIAQRAWELIQNQRQRARPSAVAATCAKPPDLTGAVPILMNGDPVTVTITLAPPPQVPVTVSASSGPLKVDPPSITFPAGSGPQQATVSSKGVEASGEDGMPVAVTWSGAGVVGQGIVEFRIRLVDLTFDPPEPELQYDASHDAWVGEFTVQPGPEMASESTLEVTLSADPEEGDQLTFDPPTLSFTASGAADGVPPRKAKATWRHSGARRRRKFGAAAKTVPLGKAGDGLRRSPRLRKAEQYSAQVTMVDAGRGLSLVVRIDKGDGTSQYVVVDGGLTSSYPNIAAFLPGAIHYVVCTHYDDDHIAGLIVLLNQRGGDVGRVLFNPPPGGAGCDAQATPLPGGAVSEEQLLPVLAELMAAKEGLLNVYSPQQGRCLQQLAGARLLSPITAMPPPATTIGGASLYRTAWQFGGPTTLNLENMEATPTNGEYVNRASLLFTLAAQDGAGNAAPRLFSLLVTGDGTNMALRQDVVGFSMTPRHVQFLQVPHHGSNYNSDITLYSQVTASHYLISSRWSPHGHPGSEVIRSIVAGNRLRNKTGYTIWISDPTFRKGGGDDGQLTAAFDGFFPRPMGTEYSVRLAVEGNPGLTFAVADGVVTPPPPSDWTTLAITPLSTTRPDRPGASSAI